MIANYYAGINEQLFRQVPTNAKKILEIGCGYGNFGERVKSLNPGVTYYAIEIDPEAAKIAASKLDHVICGNVESTSLVDGDFDCVIFGDVLEHLCDPLEILRKIRPMLKPTGCVLCSVPNVQHHSVLSAILGGDFQYQDAGLLDRTHLRFFTYASFIKLMLDAGLLPQIVDVIQVPPEPEFFETLKGSLQFLGRDFELSREYISAYQYIFQGTVNLACDPAPRPGFPISFIVPTNDRRVLRDNFASSPIFRGSHPHQLIQLEQQACAADALEHGIRQAEHEFVVYLHQDVYLPHHWDAVFCRKVTEAERLIKDAGMFGVYGVCLRDGKLINHGHVMDRHCHLNYSKALPAVVDSVDELLIGFRKESFPGTDRMLGYHLYGTDLACRYRDGGRSAVVVDAPCFHNSSLGFSVPAGYLESMPYLKTSWHKYLPLATSCGIILPN